MKSRISDYKINTCRICKSKSLYEFLSLGKMPIPNGFVSKEELHKKEEKYPLSVCVCERCWLVQLTHTIPPEIMFKNYLYIPSTSSTMMKHFKNFADEAIKQYVLTKEDMVVDIGSNDGTLLSFFKERGVKVLGVDPASNLAHVAGKKGVTVLDDFFTAELAKEITKQYGKASVVTATNVVAHIHDLHDLIRGIEMLLARDGTFIMEFPYFVDLLDKNEFDTIHHEHLSYFAVKPLIKLFASHAMRIVDIKRTMVHGGSIRVYAVKKSSRRKASRRVQKFVRQETLKQLHKRSTYDDFARRVKTIKRDLVAYLKNLKKQGFTIGGYGASAKGNVLLNYCKITPQILDFIVDSIHYKQGKYTPGTHIRIYPESKLLQEQPAYTILLAWNFAEEILAKQIAYRENGGRFIITIPFLRIE